MANINLTAAIRSNLGSLQTTSKLLSMTQERLATGQKVNSAIDNPSSFFTAKSLNDRASDLGGRVDGIGQGIQALKTADKALNALDSLVKNAKSLANRAKDESSTTTSASKTGGAATAGTTLGTAVAAGSSSVHVYTDSGTTLKMVIRWNAGTVQDVVDAYDAAEGITASYDEDTRKFTIETDEDYATSLNVVSRTGGGASLKISTGTASATESISADAVKERKALSKEFDDLLDQMKNLVEDASYKGTNLLAGNNLEVKFNEDGTSKIDIKGVKFDPTDTSGDMKIADATFSWKTDASIDTSLAEIEKAIGAIRTQASTFGSNLSVLQTREEFTNDMIGALEEGAGKLVLADMNEEAANMLALQTRQQLATTSLSMASQAEQGVLRLF